MANKTVILVVIGIVAFILIGAMIGLIVWAMSGSDSDTGTTPGTGGTTPGTGGTTPPPDPYVGSKYLFNWYPYTGKFSFSMKNDMSGDNLALLEDGNTPSKVTIEKLGDKYAIKFANGQYLGGSTTKGKAKPNDNPVGFDFVPHGSKGHFTIKGNGLFLSHVLEGGFKGNYFLHWSDDAGTWYGSWKASDTLNWGTKD